jgi:hypothetical protein
MVEAAEFVSPRLIYEEYTHEALATSSPDHFEPAPERQGRSYVKAAWRAVHGLPFGGADRFVGVKRPSPQLA